MEFGFLFWFYLIGLFFVACQDFKRHEIDDWLNLLLLVGGSVFILYESFLLGESGRVFLLAFLLIFVFIVQMIFYQGRVFAGGDAKLLYAMTPFLLGVDLVSSLLNVGVFALFLMVSGSVYGLVYCFVLYSRNFKDVNKEMGRSAKVLGIRYWVLGLVFIFLGYFNFNFLLFGAWLILFVLLYVFSKGLESVFMIKKIKWKDLREGDLLAEDVRVGKRLIRVKWEGLSLKEIGMLKGREVLIKDGIPFGVVFGIAFLLYVFFRGWFFGLF